MGYRHGFVIEYVPKEGKGVDCRNCIHADMEDKSCLVKPILFSEHGYGQWKHCNSFEIRKANEEPVKRKKKKKNKKPLSLADIEKEIKAERKKEIELKNRTIISVANELHYFDNENSIVDCIKKGQNITLLDNELPENVCKCGGQLSKRRAIKLFLKIKDEQVYISISGKRCQDCKCRYIDRQQFINRIQSIKMEQG